MAKRSASNQSHVEARSFLGHVHSFSYVFFYLGHFLRVSLGEVFFQFLQVLIPKLLALPLAARLFKLTFRILPVALGLGLIMLMNFFFGL